MAPRKFHLAWFSNFSLDEWQQPFASGGGNPWNGRFHTEFAQALERACFDFMMLEDSLMLSEAYGGSTTHYLKHAIHVPKHDPVPLAAVIGSHTRHIGIVPTMSTLGYTPFLLARLAATIDHITEGRFGWNIVTSAEKHAAQNFGLDRMVEHDARYDMADEFMDVVNALFDSWDPDAVVMDRDRHIYADAAKVRPINYKGKYYSSRGPLNTAPSPQRRPTYVQAGGSPRGRDFAARDADCIVAAQVGVKSMKAFRDDIRERARRFGRNPDDIKVLYLFAPVLGETEEEAIAKNTRSMMSEAYMERAVGMFSALTDIDFSKFDLDKPLPELSTDGETTALKMFTQPGSGKPFRQLIREAGKATCVDVVGTPEQVADRMAAIMDEVGGDGFLIKHPFHLINRRYIHEITDGLVPALQRRGLVRTEYTQPTLRETLREF